MMMILIYGCLISEETRLGHADSVHVAQGLYPLEDASRKTRSRG